MAFDTLSYARRLKAAGMPEAQAEAVADATRELVISDFATKADILALRAEIAAVRSDLTHEIAAMGLQITVRLGALIAVGVGILAALIKL
jgi:hypothetical protein